MFVFANAYLDLAPRRDVVGDTFAELWKGPAPDGGRGHWLVRYGEHVILKGLDKKVVTLVGEPGETWPTFPASGLRPSGFGPVCVKRVEGTFDTWIPGTPPVEAWRPDQPGEYTCWSLGPDRLLVTQWLGDWRESLTAISLSDRHVLWTIPSAHPVEAVVPQGVLSSRATDPTSPSHLECRDPETGAIRWKTEWPFGLPLALVDDVLWSPGRFELLRLDMRSGTLLEPVAIPQTAVPNGVVDERGIFHSSHGSNYQVYDLRDNGRELSSLRFKLTFVGPKSGAGPGNMVVTPDGRMIFGDHGGNVWVVHPDRPTQPERVWQGKSHIFGLLAHRGRLVVLFGDGRLAILGKP